MHVSTGQPISHREFNQWMSDVQFSAELEKQLKKETEKLDENELAVPSNDTSEMRSGLVGKIAFKGKV